MAYASVTNVEEELNGTNITSSTSPSSDTVTNWLDTASSKIDHKTGQVWNSVSSTETYDYRQGDRFIIANTPIISIDKLEYNENGLRESPSWVELNEGYNSDFIVYPDGEVMFIDTKPSSGYKNVKVQYTYGRSTTPSFIKELATKIVSRRVINAVKSSTAQDGGGDVSVGTVRISEPGTFSKDHLNQLDREIQSLFSNIGTFKLYKSKRRWD